MNIVQQTGIAGMLFALLGTSADAQQGYLTANGKLAADLTIEVSETGGFVGEQTYSFHVGADGHFTRQYRIGNGPVRQMAGTLSHDQLSALGRTLAEQGLGNLPARVVGSARPAAGAADIPTVDVRIAFGGKQVTARYVMGTQEDPPLANQIAAVNHILLAVRQTTDTR